MSILKIYLPSHMRTAVSAWGSKGVVAVSKLIMIPLMIDYLGVDFYAAFVLLASLEGWFLLCDFGIGLSLQNFISEFNVQKKPIDSLIKAAFYLSLGALSIGLLVLYFIKGPLSHFLLGRILPDPILQVTLFATCAVLFLLGTMGAIASRVYYALHKGAKVYHVQALSCAVGLAGILSLMASYQGENKLIYSLILSIGIPSCLSLAFWGRCLYKVNWQARVERSLWKAICKRAKDFWVFSCLAAAVLLVDSFVISRTLDAVQIVEYSFLQKLFGTIAFAFTAILQGLWPECSELMVQRNFATALHRIRKYCGIGLLMIALFTMGVLFIFDPLQQFFLESKRFAVVPILTVLLFGFYQGIRVISDMHAMVLQSFSDLKVFLYLVPLQAGISISGQYFLSLHYGINGILAGLILSYLLTVFWALPLRFKWIQRRSTILSKQMGL